MSRSFVLLSALPPTTGHLQLIQFANTLADDGVRVILETHDGEPFIAERKQALQAALARLARGWADIQVVHNLPQDPEKSGFKEMWKGILIGAGIQPEDYIVTSEPYGHWVARVTGTTWMPYDIEREINDIHASYIRENPKMNWRNILPEFRRHLITRVTIFGAEFTGKTTLAQNLTQSAYYTTFLPEYARTYLEATNGDICESTMTAIWHGQAALQRQPLYDSPVIVQDTDLFTTWKYWSHWNTTRKYKLSAREPLVNDELMAEAYSLSSDLYIITPSNIPFKQDAQRYGPDKREIEDRQWMNLLASMNIPFEVLKCEPLMRLFEADKMIEKAMREKQKAIVYTREHNHL